MEHSGGKQGRREIVAAIEDNLFACWRAFASYPEVDFHEGEDMMRFISGINYPLCNNVMRARIDGPGLEEKVDGALDAFRTRGLPMLWWTGPSTRPTGLGEVLLARGLTLAQDAPGMAMELTHGEGAPPPPSVATMRVDDEEGLVEWGRVFTEAFEIPDSASDFFTAVIRHLGLGGERPLRHYLGTYEGDAAACASLFIHEGVAGIYNVATLERFRGRGIGSHLSRQALEEGAAAGCRLAILHATDMGFPVYRKLGFESHCTVSAYMLG